MRIYDISVPLCDELHTYPGDGPFQSVPWSRIADGDMANVSRLTLCTHAGTHIDPPLHFSDQGGSVDEIPLELLIGKTVVLDIPGVQAIGRKELERLPVKGFERVLLKTKNSELWKQPGFCRDFAALSQEGAEYLLEAGVKLVGIDYLSIEGMDGDGGVHRTLLGNGILIVEGLNLAEVAAGEYELICLPLKIKGGDGAPVRALLRGGPGSAAEPVFDPHSTKWPLS